MLFFLYSCFLLVRFVYPSDFQPDESIVKIEKLIKDKERFAEMKKFFSEGDGVKFLETPEFRKALKKLPAFYDRLEVAKDKDDKSIVCYATLGDQIRFLSRIDFYWKVSSFLRSLRIFFDAYQELIVENERLIDQISVDQLILKLLEYLKRKIAESKNQLCVKMREICERTLAGIKQPDVTPAGDGLSTVEKVLIGALVTAGIIAIATAVFFIVKRLKK